MKIWLLVSDAEPEIEICVCALRVGKCKHSLRTRISMWGMIIFVFYCHIRKVILSIVEEHSCTVYAAPLTANGTNKKQFFSLQKARSMSSTEPKKTKDRIYKHYKTEWLRKIISTRTSKLRNMQPFSFAFHYEESFFMSHWARLQKNKPWDEKHEREVSPPASEYKRETLLRSSGASYKSVEM